MYTETQEERDRKMAEYFSEATLAKGKKKPSESNALTSKIIKWFKASGGIARRVNVMGIYMQDKGKYRPSGMLKGYEDIDACMPVRGLGLKIAIEVKVGKDYQKPEQVVRQQEIESVGGVYLIAKDYEQFVRDITAVLSRYN